MLGLYRAIGAMHTRQSIQDMLLKIQWNYLEHHHDILKQQFSEAAAVQQPMYKYNAYNIFTVVYSRNCGHWCLYVLASYYTSIHAYIVWLSFLKTCSVYVYVATIKLFTIASYTPNINPMRLQGIPSRFSQLYMYRYFKLVIKIYLSCVVS